MDEIIVVVEDASEGGYIARALGSSIVTEADDVARLRQRVRDAVKCHFEDGKMPSIIRLHFTRDEFMAV